MKTSAFKDYLVAAPYVLAMTIAGTAVSGCDFSGCPAVSTHLIVGFDTSVSARSAGILGRGVLLTTRLVRRLQPGRDRLTLFRVDNRTEEFLDQAVPTSSLALQEMIVAAVKPAPSHPRTLPARFWTGIAARMAKDRQPTAILFISDGDNDDLSARSRASLHAAARKLAANPHVLAVAISGALPENWEWLRDIFEPLGDRLLLSGPQQMDAEPLVRCLNRSAF